MSGKNRKKRVNWTDNEIIVLLNHWEERIIDLRKSKRNLKICVEIARKLEECNVHKTAQEVATKISNLTKKFRLEKKLGGLSGGDNWRYFDDVNRILSKFSCDDNTLMLENSIDFSSEATLLSPSSGSMDSQNALWAMEHSEATASTSKKDLETPFSTEEKSFSALNVDDDFNITVKSEIEDEFCPEEHSLSRTAAPPMHEESIPLPSNASNQSTSKTSIHNSVSGRRTENKRKRNNLHLQEELLEEIKRSNRIFEEEIKKANEIDKECVNIQKQMLELFKTMYN